MAKMNDVIDHDGNSWRIVGIGITREDGLTYCHLSSKLVEHEKEIDREAASLIAAKEAVDRVNKEEAQT